MKLFVLSLKGHKFYAIFLAFGIIILNIAGSCSTDSKNGEAFIDPNRTYSITYNGNGHNDGQAPVDGLAYKSMDEVKVLAKETLLREGYIFDGWNTKADGTGDDHKESAILIVSTSNVILYAKWLNEVEYHELIASNVNVIDILNIAPRSDDNWYHASVDIINGSLTLNDTPSSSKLQFLYRGIDGVSPENKGYLQIKFNQGFHTASNAGRALDLPKGRGISASTFLSAGKAEISGLNHNWGDISNKYIPVVVTNNGEIHYGYIKVSFKDLFGQLTIHGTAYNMIPDKEIITGEYEN